jgi:hypothetical protein
MMNRGKEWIIIGATNPDPIRDTFDVCYWNSFTGWVDDLTEAELFSDDIKEFGALPPGGQWLEIGGILK